MGGAYAYTFPASLAEAWWQPLIESGFQVNLSDARTPLLLPDGRTLKIRDGLVIYKGDNPEYVGHDVEIDSIISSSLHPQLLVNSGSYQLGLNDYVGRILLASGAKVTSIEEARKCRSMYVSSADATQALLKALSVQDFAVHEGQGMLYRPYKRLWSSVPPDYVCAVEKHNVVIVLYKGQGWDIANKKPVHYIAIDYERRPLQKQSTVEVVVSKVHSSLLDAGMRQIELSGSLKDMV